MPSISLFGGIFCKKGAVAEEVLDKTGYRLVTDKDLVAEASSLSDLAENKMERIFAERAVAFDRFTHEYERSMASLKLALARKLSGDNLLIFGFSGLLIPKTVSHVLRVCLIADMKFRKSIAKGERDVSEKEALRLIHHEDMDCAKWIHTLFGKTDPWDSSLYDILVPMDRTSVRKAAELIVDNVNSDVLRVTGASTKRVADFVLAAEVGAVFAKEGHGVDVSAENGTVTLVIDRQGVKQNRLEDELKSMAEEVQGVRSVEIQAGRDYYQTGMHRKHDFELPSKVLLVDDERTFVQTLSERLMLRNMGAAVAFDGESALELIKEDKPEVLVLDLRMPGIDGMEVLRQIKTTHHDIEIIILTGHGSEADRDTCIRLGALDFLKKPVEIDLLTDALRRAKQKIQQKKAEA
jgi:two-component system response regulator CpxR